MFDEIEKLLKRMNYKEKTKYKTVKTMPLRTEWILMHDETVKIANQIVAKKDEITLLMKEIEFKREAMWSIINKEINRPSLNIECVTINREKGVLEFKNEE